MNFDFFIFSHFSKTWLPHIVLFSTVFLSIKSYSIYIEQVECTHQYALTGSDLNIILGIVNQHKSINCKYL